MRAGAASAASRAAAIARRMTTYARRRMVLQHGPASHAIPLFGETLAHFDRRRAIRARRRRIPPMRKRAPTVARAANLLAKHLPHMLDLRCVRRIGIDAFDQLVE